MEEKKYPSLSENVNEEGKWKIVKSEYLSHEPWMTARKDCVELPDGRRNPAFYVLEYADWVNVIALTEDGRMVMERQYRHGLGLTCYEMPCGVIEKGERPLEAAKRELQEETGFGDGDWSLFMVLSPNPSCNTNMVYTYLAKGVKKVSGQQFDANEDLSVHILSKEKVFQLLKNNEIYQALMAAPLWRYFSEEPIPPEK